MRGLRDAHSAHLQVALQKIVARRRGLARKYLDLWRGAREPDAEESKVGARVEHQPSCSRQLDARAGRQVATPRKDLLVDVHCL